MSDDVSTYRGSTIDVTWDKRLCIHVGECGRADNEMFQGGRKPWCDPDTVDAQTAADVVQRCPSGALAYTRQDGVAETPADDNVIVVSNNGPLYARGELNIDGAADDMPGVRFRAALCRCGQSKNKPFCDGAHEAANFVDHGAVGKTTLAPLEAHGGELKITPSPNGPLVLEGNVRIVASSGRVAWEGTNCALCRCGGSNNKPFCDGTHRKIGFQSE